MTQTTRLAALAELMGLTPDQAVTLPALITVASGKVGMRESDFLFHCETNPKLREYLGTVAADVAATAGLEVANG